MTVLTLAPLPSGVDLGAAPVLPEQRTVLPQPAAGGTAARSASSRYRLDPASTALRPAGTRRVTLLV